MRKKESRKKPTAPGDPNRYPKGWNRKRVLAVAKYYENQSDEEAMAELEAAFDNEESAMMQVPLKLVPEVRKLLAKRAG